MTWLGAGWPRVTARLAARWRLAGRARRGAAGDRPSVAVAEQQVGRRPGQEREPVGGDPVRESGQDCVGGPDVGQDQQAAEAGLDDAEPARGDREQRDDSPRRIVLPVLASWLAPLSARRLPCYAGLRITSRSGPDHVER